MPRFVVGALALVFALAGCGGDPVADPSPTPSTPVSTAPTVSPAPTMPAEALANTKAGAVAFVRHYIDLLNFAQVTGRTDELAKLEDPNCVSCTKVSTYLSQIYAGGGAVQGGRWVIQHISATRGPDDGTWVVEVLGKFEPSTVVPSSGATPRTTQGGPAPTTFYLRHTSQWTVTKWTRGV